MALLARDPGRVGGAGRRGMAAVALLAVVAGCVVFGSFAGEESGRFSHRLHVDVEQLECVMCHADAGVREEPGMPDPDTCDLCHSELDGDLLPEDRIAALFSDGDFVQTGAGALADEVAFPHLAHVGRLPDCAACHARLVAADTVDASTAVDMDACVACHRRQEVPADCATCHTVVDTDWAPPNHTADWRLVHGPTARGPHHGEQQTRCDTCHDETTCVECHLLEPPRTHNQHWRQRGHGITAMIDRTSCSTCHQSSECDTCHDFAIPLSHSGVFGGVRNLHCVGCHEPLSKTTCAVCHTDTPSHAFAPPKPSWHTPTMNCRECHGATIPLLHADNGANCNACHD